MDISKTNALALQAQKLVYAIEECGASPQLTNAVIIASDLVTKLDRINTKTAKQDFLANSLKDGEKYAGIILGKNGEPDHHLILLPGQANDVSHKDAQKFATQAGGELPTRREQSLLYANLKEEFEERWYWSGELHASDASCAWCQSFSSGYQDRYPLGDKLRARAVRRIVIE